MEQIGNIIQRLEKKRESQRISREFQDYGVRLAEVLGDSKHKSLYIKLSKEKPRKALEEALSYVMDYPHAKNRGRLFMWKLKELLKTTG
jgi:hypothetical protein